jgi:D-3-phosphoglycerate dehydrogenase
MKVIFLDTVHRCLQDTLEDKGFACDDHTETPRDELKNALPDYDGIVVRSRMPMDEDLLKHATSLKFIARSGAGMENIDITYCESHNIALFNAPEGNRDAVGEQAIGMLLALFNKLLQADAQVRKGIWDREGNRGYELGGKTVGIIGYGNNGSAFARKLSGFDCTVLAYDKYKSGFGSGAVEEVQMDAIFERADVLSFHIPQNEETLFLCDEPYLKRFRKPLYIINLARGKIIQTDALVAGLTNETILGACLDVLEYEKASFEQLNTAGLPNSFKYLLNSDRVVLAPHVGGWTHESYYKLSKVLADKILSKFTA